MDNSFNGYIVSFSTRWPYRKIYILKPPSDACPENKVWKLNKCLYGLNDASRSWYVHAKSEMLKAGGKISIHDLALYIWYDEENASLQGILGSHVDNFVYCGGKKWQESIKVSLSAFKISSQTNTSFQYLGLNVVQTSEGVLVDQIAYISTACYQLIFRTKITMTGY